MTRLVTSLNRLVPAASDSSDDEASLQATTPVTPSLEATSRHGNGAIIAESPPRNEEVEETCDWIAGWLEFRPNEVNLESDPEYQPSVTDDVDYEIKAPISSLL